MSICIHCNYPYSTEDRCPNCGSKDPSGLAEDIAKFILIIIIGILIFLTPGLFVTSIIDYIFQIGSELLWVFTISISLVYVGYLFFNFRDDFIKIYFWTCGIITAIILLLSLISTENIFLETLGGLFSQDEKLECTICSSDGCIENSDIETLAFNYELQNTDEIQRFQDWLDENHPNWIKHNGKYVNLNSTEQYPTRHINGVGYGECGPQTKMQFENFKVEFLPLIFPVGPCQRCEINGDCE